MTFRKKLEPWHLAESETGFMDLNSMVKREDFFNIFFATISEYYRSVYSVEADVTFSAESKRHTNLVVYPKLSAAVARKMSSAAKEFFLSEWNIRGNPIKSNLARSYVRLMTASRGCLSQYRMNIQPESLLHDSLVIAPNNRSIRFFNYSEGTVGCMIKKGFSDKYFSQQLQFRLHNNQSFILPMIRYGERWFIEPILHGHPLARITNDSLYKKAMTETITDLGVLAKDSIHYIDCKDYILGLREGILSSLENAVKRKHINTGEMLKSIVEELSGYVLSSGISVPIVTSHGDLQSGNIWVEDTGKVWVYDWETVEERSVWYDAATLLLSTRRAGGIERLWNNCGSNDTKQDILFNDSKKNYTDDDMRNIARIVLLEDVVFYLADMLELPEDWGTEIFDGYILRLANLVVKQ